MGMGEQEGRGRPTRGAPRGGGFGRGNAFRSRGVFCG